MNIKRWTAGGALAVAGVLAVGTAIPAQAASWESHGDSWDSDEDNGGRDIYAALRLSDDPVDRTDRYRVWFDAYDEIFTVEDNDKDGHKAKGYISVAGEGTATYVTTGKWWDLNFAEGKAVSIKVCKNGTQTCSKWYSGRT